MTGLATTRQAKDIDDPDHDPAALEPLGPSTWVTGYEPSWVAFGGILGGLVVASLARAAEQAAGRRAATVAVHFHSPVTPGSAELQADVIREGRSAASVSVTARQEKLRASALVLLEGEGDQAPPGGLPLLADPMPASAPEQSAPLERAPGGVELPFFEHVEIRPTGDSFPLAGGPDAVLRAWIRPRRAIDDPVTRAAVLLDALAPSLFAIWHEPVLIPTIELTMHLAPAGPVSEWSAISQRTVWFNDAYCVNEADLRNDDGSLIAQARQRRKLLGQSAGSWGTGERQR